MSTRRWGLAFVAVWLLMPRAASAETKEELARGLEAYIDFVADPAKYTTAAELAYPSERYKCRELESRARAGFAGDDELVSRRFGGHPEARPVGDSFAVKVTDLGWICARMGSRLDETRFIGMIALSKAWEGLAARGVSDDDRSRMTAAEAHWIDAVTVECELLVTTMTSALAIDAADGKRDGKMDGGVEINHAYPALAGARPCEAMKTWNDIYQAEWTKQLAVIARPFEDAGIAGERLATLLSKAPALYYAPDVDGWVIDGCKRVKTIKQLKKAKELVWVHATRDHQIAISRYQFKGDTVSARTFKTFPTVKAAFKTRCRI
jgi:hypothetical protein